MFMKSKVCFTVFVLYEIIVIPLLHFKSTCGAIFGAEFCTGGFKYFPWAIALPLLVYIIWMWIHEIVRARRRRRFIGKAKNIMTGITTSVHERLKQISANDLEQIIIAAVLVGIKKYSMRHPGLRQTLDEILGSAYGADMEYDVEYTAPKETKPKKRTVAKRASATVVAKTSKKKK